MKGKQGDQQENALPDALYRPARRALVEAGYRRLQQLAEISQARVKQVHGIGPKAIDQLRRASRIKVCRSLMRSVGKHKSRGKPWLRNACTRYITGEAGSGGRTMHAGPDNRYGVGVRASASWHAEHWAATAAGCGSL